MFTRKTLMQATLVASLTAFWSGAATAATLHVPANHPTIQRAINAASDGDEIVVAPGTYFGTVKTNGKRLHIRSFAGPELTTISAANLQDQTAVVWIDSGESRDTIIEGFTITGGKGVPTSIVVADGESFTFETFNVGGGVYINNAAPIIRNCIIKSNNAQLGGGLFAAGTALIEDCIINSNLAAGGGGAMLMHNAKMRSTHIHNNYAWQGGGLMIRSATVEFCTIEDNTAEDFGGGVGVDSRGFGSLTATVSDTTIRGNHSMSVGGGVGSVFSRPTIGPLGLRMQRCLIERNSAVKGGGVGVQAYGPSAPLVFENSMILANSASEGGGVYFDGENNVHHFDIVNSTISGNLSPNNGAGVQRGGSAQLRIVNTIMWGNTLQVNGGPGVSDTEGSQILSSGASGLSVSHSLLPTLSTHTDNGNIQGDPGFVNPYGLDGQIATEGADLRLRPDSICFDAGHGVIAAERLTDTQKDFSGAPRLIDGNKSTPRGVPVFGMHIDIGAMEFQPEEAIACPADLTGDGLVGSADLATLLSSWGVCP
ncbi:MAG: hypothetical protein EA376_00110 [Phycisphaeraceae bacterium]|nr:MAG: hypothetical protein EA376_00110 [Phycisphaeraceae bacterium]